MSRKVKFLSIILLVFIFATQNIFAQAGNEKQPKIEKLLSKKDTPTTIPTDTLSKKTDRDGDGILDAVDKCPDEKGVLQYDGCPMPDSDNDGVADDIDECPNDAGVIKYKGCPIPDRDSDKINDELDKCPDVPGYARFDGCPTRDTDGDGVNDDDDKCIDIAGPAANSGCPETRAYRKLLKKEDGKKKSATPADKN